MGTVYIGVYTVPVEPTSCRLRRATLTGSALRGAELLGYALDSFLTRHFYHLLSFWDRVSSYVLYENPEL